MPTNNPSNLLYSPSTLYPTYVHSHRIRSSSRCHHRNPVLSRLLPRLRARGRVRVLLRRPSHSRCHNLPRLLRRPSRPLAHLAQGTRNMAYPKPSILIYLTDTETGETTVTNTITGEQYNLSEKRKPCSPGLVNGGLSNPTCFICGADLTGKDHGSCGLGHYCLECSEEAEYYVNSMRGRGFHGTR